MTVPPCPCCQSAGAKPVDVEHYFQCDVCALCFLDPARRLDAAAEVARYRRHNNDPDDEGYLRFLTPVAEACMARRPPPAALLDYGSGPTPVLSDRLKREGYQVTSYDPLFPVDDLADDARFDLVVACEVIEHFYHPDQEFARIRARMYPGATLVISTYFYPPTQIGFLGWHYRQDPTHVVFYTTGTLNWLADTHGFEAPEILSARLAVMRVRD